MFRERSTILVHEDRFTRSRPMTVSGRPLLNESHQTVVLEPPSRRTADHYPRKMAEKPS